MTMLTLYGAEASGAVSVEAALTLLGLPYRPMRCASRRNHQWL
jgi:hypothetical protein